MALWSSHPFSVAWAEDKTRSPSLEIDMENLPSNNSSELSYQGHRLSLVPRSSVNFKGGTRTLATVREVAQKPKLPNPSTPNDASVILIFLIMRARTGVTRQLYNMASASPGRRFTICGAIEGPYGGHETFASYGTVLLFAGGVASTHSCASRSSSPSRGTATRSSLTPAPCRSPPAVAVPLPLFRRRCRNVLARRASQSVGLARLRIVCARLSGLS